LEGYWEKISKGHQKEVSKSIKFYLYSDFAFATLWNWGGYEGIYNAILKKSTKR
jgi:hypothetical protein